MKYRPRAFVSGPLNGDGTDDKKANVDRAVKLGLELLTMGYAPYISHLTWYADPDDEYGYENWLDVDRAFLRVSDILVRLPGASYGADLEENMARNMGIPVYYHVGNVPYLEED